MPIKNIHALFFHKLRVSIVCLCLVCFCGVAPVQARVHNADITCEQLPESPEKLSGLLFYWLPGWWSAHHNDPYVNEMRIHLLVEAVLRECQNNPQTRILDAVKRLASMPPVPDHALSINCRDLMNSEPLWQALVIYWLQGYYAYKNGNTLLDDDYPQLLAAYEQACSDDGNLTMGDLARTIKIPSPRKQKDSPILNMR